jgi:catechol 2,3-dioxygenase-like lactoylglutathione lyase family enzyme
MEKEIGVMKFDHVHIKCHDVKEVERFYRDTLGANTIEQYSIRNTETIMMELGDVFLTLTNASEGEDLEAAKRPIETPNVRYGLGHFGIRVKNLDRAAQILKEKGVEFLWTPRDSKGGTIRVAFIRGPENDVIELVQRGK